MKTLLIAILLFVSVNCYSQFSVVTLVGQGIKLNSEFDYSIYQTSIMLTPTYQIGKVTLSEINTSFITDSTTEFAIGISPAYILYDDTFEMKKFSISGVAMFGNYNKQYYGGGFGYETENMTIGLQYLYETKLKENLIQAVLGFKVYRE